MQAVKMRILPDGTVRYLYDDDVFRANKDDFVHDIYRASHIHFNTDTQLWDVYDESFDNKILSNYNSREQAIEDERINLEEQL